jgi:hypothetical protein
MNDIACSSGQVKGPASIFSAPAAAANPLLGRTGRPPLGQSPARHLFVQTAQSVSYLKQRLAEGRLTLPDGALALSSFGRAGTGGHPRPANTSATRSVETGAFR